MTAARGTEAEGGDAELRVAAYFGQDARPLERAARGRPVPAVSAAGDDHFLRVVGVGRDALHDVLPSAAQDRAVAQVGCAGAVGLEPGDEAVLLALELALEGAEGGREGRAAEDDVAVVVLVLERRVRFADDG